MLKNTSPFFKVLLAAMFVLSIPVLATNGDNLINVGPISRSMGGVGVAYPQDAISAVFSNPAAICIEPCQKGTEFVFAGTAFSPTVKADVTMMTPAGKITYSGESQHKTFVIPAMAITSPLNENWRFGLAAYGVSGLGVDYRNNGWDLDGDPSNGYEGDVYTRLEIMRFSPNLAYKFNDNFSVGGSLHIIYGNLDLGSGGTHDYTLGLELGALYRRGIVQFGATYTTPEKVTHGRVANFDAFMGSTTLDDLKLESPTTLAIGCAIIPNEKFFAELDARWYNWGNADGYKDFDWRDQWIVALGLQYKPTSKVALRGGFNYGKSPVREHDGFNPMGVSHIQGKATPTFGYEYLRVIGFPAVVEKHLTLGAGWDLGKGVSLNLEYMHAFEKDISETSAFGAVSLHSSLSEDSIGFGINWRF